MAKFIKEVRPTAGGGSVSIVEIICALAGSIVGMLSGNILGVLFGFTFGAIVGMAVSSTGRQKLRFFAYNFPRIFAHPEGKIYQESEIPIDKANEELVARYEESELKLQLANQKIEELQNKNRRKTEVDIEAELARRQKKAPPAPTFSISDIMKYVRGGKEKDNPPFVFFKNAVGGAGWLHDIKILSDKGRTAGVLIVKDMKGKTREFTAPSFEDIFQHPQHVQQQIEETRAFTTNFLPDGSFLKDVSVMGVNIGENKQLATIYIDSLLKTNAGLEKELHEKENIIEEHSKMWGEMDEDVSHLRKENKFLKVENTKVKNYAASQTQTTSAFGMQALDGQTSKALSDTVRRRMEAALKQSQKYIAQMEAKVENAEKNEELRDMFKLLKTSIEGGLGVKEKPEVIVQAAAQPPQQPPQQQVH